MQCGIHGTEMTYKPAGTSKIGKPYPAFWSCQTKNADESWCNFKPPANPQTQPQPIQQSKQVQQTLPTQTRRGYTDEMIAAQVALKAAVEFYSGKVTTQEAVISTSQQFLNFLLGKQAPVSRPIIVENDAPLTEEQPF